MSALRSAYASTDIWRSLRNLAPGCRLGEAGPRGHPPRSRCVQDWACSREWRLLSAPPKRCVASWRKTWLDRTPYFGHEQIACTPVPYPGRPSGLVQASRDPSCSYAMGRRTGQQTRSFLMKLLRAHSSEEDSSLGCAKGNDIRRKQDNLVRTEIGYDVSQHLHCERDGPRERADILVVRQKATIELFVFEPEVYPVEETDGPGDWVQLARSYNRQASSVPFCPA
jgi:hypothetical protein